MRIFRKKQLGTFKQNFKANFQDDIIKNASNNFSNSKGFGLQFNSRSNLGFFQSFRGKFQIFWYAIFLSIYIWFMFWICYDLFVWNKTVFEVNVSSYVGSVISLACLWIGTLIWKRKGSRKQYLQEEILLDKKDTLINTEKISDKLFNNDDEINVESAVESVHVLPIQEIQAIQGTQVAQETQTIRETKTIEESQQIETIQQDNIGYGCSHYLGYLKQKKDKQIPEECLTCKDLLNCS